MAVTVHPSSEIDPGARIGERAVIGPYCVIKEDVEIGEETNLHSHVIVESGSRTDAAITPARMRVGSPRFITEASLLFIRSLNDADRQNRPACKH